MEVLKKERGFTLIEVVASLVIITVVLLSFSQLFIQSNKIAYKNNEKLVTIQLADAILERLKADTFTYDASIEDVNNYFTYSSPNKDNKILPPTIIEMNGKEYNVSYSASQNGEIFNNASYSEKYLKLVRVVVTVTAPDKKTKGSSEGYVSLE